MDGPPAAARGRSARINHFSVVSNDQIMSAAAAAASTSPYRRLEPGEYSTDAVLSQFRSCGFCWLKLGIGMNPNSTVKVIRALKDYAKDDMDA